MRFLNSVALVAALALHQTLGRTLKAIILADTNRDGVVDIEGDSDLRSRATWTTDHGALILANIVDTDRRCSKAITDDTPNEDLDKCHDATDNVLRNSKFLAPLRTLAADKLSSSATGSITVKGDVAQDKVRVFVKDGDDWTFVTSNYTFTADELKHGLELGVDARDVRRPDVWDGKAKVHFSITDGEHTASDEVELRVAPVLTHHHLQEAERVFVTSTTGDAWQSQFVEDLEVNTADAGISEEVFKFTSRDIWTQDFFEPGYSSIPGPDGPIMLRLMIRSSQMLRSTGRQVFQHLRNEDVGAVQFYGDGDTLDSTGNLETIPPYTHHSKTYPAGRIIIGAWGDREPLIVPFLAAQETQEPIILDTAWLAVGHVDEFVQFLPADSDRGWLMMADDPLAGLDILQKASEDGHGGERAFSRPYLPIDGPYCVPHTTIDEELARPEMKELNEAAAERIENNIEILKRETGITDEEIFRVPAIFYEFGDGIGYIFCNSTNSTSTSRTSNINGGSGSSRSPSSIPPIVAAANLGNTLNRRQAPLPERQVVAHYPAAINGALLSDSFYLSANPWGPVIDGEDIFAKEVTAAYAEANYNVTYMDDWFSHHVGAGEIHCGSNIWRNADTPWW